jgi:hypothetical protein
MYAAGVAEGEVGCRDTNWQRSRERGERCKGCAEAAARVLSARARQVRVKILLRRRCERLSAATAAVRERDQFAGRRSDCHIAVQLGAGAAVLDARRFLSTPDARQSPQQRTPSLRSQQSLSLSATNSRSAMMTSALVGSSVPGTMESARLLDVQLIGYWFVLHSRLNGRGDLFAYRVILLHRGTVAGRRYVV